MLTNSYNKQNTNRTRGLTPFGAESANHLEIFEQGLNYNLVSDEEKDCPLHEETPWPAAGEEGLRFRAFAENLYSARQQLAVELMGCVASGLGKPADFFSPWYQKDGLSTIMANHYAPRSRGLVSQAGLTAE